MDFSYGDHWLLIAFTVGFALVGIILWGSLTGSMLPILLKRLGADPAASSAPSAASPSPARRQRFGLDKDALDERERCADVLLHPVHGHFKFEA